MLPYRTYNDLLVSIGGAFPDGYADEQAHKDCNDLFLGSPLGQRVLYFLLDACGMQRNPADPEGREHVTYQNIGRANFGRFLIAILTTKPAPPPDPRAETEPTEKPKEQTDGR